MVVQDLDKLQKINQELGAPVGSEKAESLAGLTATRSKYIRRRDGTSSKAQKYLRREIVAYMIAEAVPTELIVEKISTEKEYEPYVRGLTRPRQAVRKDLEAYYKNIQLEKPSSEIEIVRSHLGRLRALYQLAMKSYSTAQNDKIKHDFLARATDISQKITQAQSLLHKYQEEERWSPTGLKAGEDPLPVIDGSFIEAPQLQQPSELTIPEEMKEQEDETKGIVVSSRAEE